MRARADEGGVGVFRLDRPRGNRILLSLGGVSRGGCAAPARCRGLSMASGKLWESARWKWCLGSLVLLVGSSQAHAQLTGPTARTVAPVRKLWTAVSDSHKPAPVPPGLE